MSDLKKILIQMEDHNSPFEKEIRKLDIPVCGVFKNGDRISACTFNKTDEILGKDHSQELNDYFKNTIKSSENKVLEAAVSDEKITGKKIAVLFSGGPAAGGHNVVAGIKKITGDYNTLYGVSSGPKGLIEGQLFEITDEMVDSVLNTGGFDLLGTDRTKIKTEEQFQAVRKTALDYKLDGIIIIGGDDSNTNAAILAEYLYQDGVQVIGVPKTIDGDLQIGKLLPISFGFDSATKVYSELIGNILQDTPSSRKYWHFIKLMGRSASHVALEVALQTRAAITLISEEVAEKNMSLNDIVNQMVDVIAVRAAKKINHGVVIVPEGLIEFIPEMKEMIGELNEIMVEYDYDLRDKPTLNEKKDFVYKKLTPKSAQLMAALPDDFKKMLLLDRDSHGNLQVSQIPTEKLLIEMVAERLHEVKKHPSEIAHLEFSVEEMKRFKAFRFSPNSHFFGYEGRCGAPTRFDAVYCYNLGLATGSLILNGKTGYIVSIQDFDKGGTVKALPLSGLINTERRHGKDEKVIKKGLVELDSPAFSFFDERRKTWNTDDHFTSPGPRQLWGPVSNQIPYTVALNQEYGTTEFKIGEK